MSTRPSGAVATHDSGPGGVPGLWRSQLKVDLTWRCGASPPLHGTFMEDARWLGETHQVGTTQRILALIESRL